MFPVLNYFLSVLNFKDQWLNEVESLIENFVTQGQNISKKRLYLAPDRGGLGLFKIRDFQIALQCSWVKRVMDVKHDNWRNSINECCMHGILFVQETDAEPLSSLLKGII
jgi:hypothetical protein